MPSSTALASHNSNPAPRENLRPVLSDLRLEHSRHVEKRLPSVNKSGSVKWSTARKNYCVLTLPDKREAFLHRDDFEGDWPPRFPESVDFEELIDTPGQPCPVRAKEARLAEAK